MSQVISVTTEPPVDPDTPTPTHYQLLAAELMAVLDQMAAILPKLEEAETVTAKSARANLNVSDAFCAIAINAVEQVPELDASKKLDAEKGRNRLQFLEAFRPMSDKVTAFGLRLSHALMVIKSQLATDSLQIYRIAKGHASDGRSPAMAAHVAALKRALGRRALTRAERAEHKARKFKEAVDAAVAEVLAQREHELKAA